MFLKIKIKLPDVSRLLLIDVRIFCLFMCLFMCIALLIHVHLHVRICIAYSCAHFSVSHF